MLDRDKWQTPQVLWDKLNKQYIFSFDCCANEDSSDSKCNVWSFDFLNENNLWTTDTCWMNPPFSKAKEMFKHFFQVVPKGVAIYRCDNMETSVWQDIILKNATWIAIPKGRIAYEGFKGNGSRFPSELIGFNVDTPKLENWTILKTSRNEYNETET